MKKKSYIEFNKKNWKEINGGVGIHERENESNDESGVHDIGCNTGY